MKKELSPALVVGSIIGIVVVIGFALLMLVRSDPASQAPNPPPRFSAAAKEAETHGRQPQASTPPEAPGGASKQ